MSGKNLPLARRKSLDDEETVHHQEFARSVLFEERGTSSPIRKQASCSPWPQSDAVLIR
jgi:hypothetical protein